MRNRTVRGSSPAAERDSYRQAMPVGLVAMQVLHDLIRDKDGDSERFQLIRTDFKQAIVEAYAQEQISSACCSAMIRANNLADA